MNKLLGTGLHPTGDFDSFMSRGYGRWNLRSYQMTKKEPLEAAPFFQRRHRRVTGMKRFITIAVAAAVLTALLFGSVTAAHASPISRANAVRSAKSYLQFSAFSYKGLVSQLKYEKFSTSDAAYGASHSGANWNQQAVKAAKSYLRYSAFSRSGLVEQLKYDGFTTSQALYGVRATGL
jgi:hypothetical protein